MSCVALPTRMTFSAVVRHRTWTQDAWRLRDVFDVPTREDPRAWPRPQSISTTCQRSDDVFLSKYSCVCSLTTPRFGHPSWLLTSIQLRMCRASTAYFFHPVCPADQTFGRVTFRSRAAQPQRRRGYAERKKARVQHATRQSPLMWTVHQLNCWRLSLRDRDVDTLVGELHLWNFNGPDANRIDSVSELSSDSQMYSVLFGWWKLGRTGTSTGTSICWNCGPSNVRHFVDERHLWNINCLQFFSIRIMENLCRVLPSVRRYGSLQWCSTCLRCSSWLDSKRTGSNCCFGKLLVRIRTNLCTLPERKATFCKLADYPDLVRDVAEHRVTKMDMTGLQSANLFGRDTRHDLLKPQRTRKDKERWPTISLYDRRSSSKTDSITLVTIAVRVHFGGLLFASPESISEDSGCLRISGRCAHFQRFSLLPVLLLFVSPVLLWEAPCSLNTALHPSWSLTFDTRLFLCTCVEVSRLQIIQNHFDAERTVLSPFALAEPPRIWISPSFRPENDTLR